MPITEKDIFEVLNIEADPATIADSAAFKEMFEKSFTSKKNPDAETKTAMFGTEFGVFKTKMKQLFKKNEIDWNLSEEDFKGKNFAQLLEYVDGEIGKKYSSLIEEAKTSASATPNEKVTALEADINKWKLTAQEEKQAREAALQELGTKEKAWGEEKKGIHKKFKLDDIHAKEMKWASGVNDLTKRGFWGKISEKYDNDIDENGELVTTDKKGNRIPHPTKTGQFLSYVELLQKEALEENIWEKNPHGQQGAKKITPQPQGQPVAPQGQSGQPLNVVAPRQQLGTR